MLVGKQEKNMLFGPLFFYTTKNVQKIFSEIVTCIEDSGLPRWLKE